MRLCPSPPSLLTPNSMSHLHKMTFCPKLTRTLCPFAWPLFDVRLIHRQELYVGTEADDDEKDDKGACDGDDGGHEGVDDAAKRRRGTEDPEDA